LDRLEAFVEREADTFWRGVERARKAKHSASSKRRPASRRYQSIFQGFGDLIGEQHLAILMFAIVVVYRYNDLRHA
jgi:hypothetical protein